MTEEIWKPIPGYGGHYEASSFGRIRVLDRTVSVFNPRLGISFSYHKRGHVMSDNKRGQSGHKCVGLTADGKTRSVFVHTLVLLAFVGLRPDGKEACHNNGIPTDNRPENLRWDTHLANNRDRLKHGTYLRGEAHPMARLSAETVRQIRASGLGPTAVAHAFNLSTTHAHRILRGESWREAA